MRHPKTLIELMQLYPTEDECRQAIFEQRWPHGFRCRRCGHECAWYLPGRGLLECASCHHQGSLTAGAILYCTRTDLRKWLLAIWLLASTKKAPAAAELSRELGKTQVAISAEQTPGGGLGRAHLHVVADASAASLSAASSATTSSDASSTAACSTPAQRPIRCSQLPERR